MVVDLLDCDVRFGQGNLFSPPRPVRAEALQGEGKDGVLRATPGPAPNDVSQGAGGVAQLARAGMRRS